MLYMHAVGMTMVFFCHTGNIEYLKAEMLCSSTMGRGSGPTDVFNHALCFFSISITVGLILTVSFAC